MSPRTLKKTASRAEGLRLTLWGMASVLALALIAWCWLWWQAQPEWHLNRINRLQLSGGLTEQQQAQVVEKVKAIAERGYFGVELEQLTAQLAQMPWVATVSVRKQWPDVLQVDLQPKQGWAYWNDEGLVTKEGEVFPALGSHPSSQLLIEASNARASDVLPMVEQMLEKLQAHLIAAEKVVVTDRGQWHLWLKDGVEIRLGRHELQQRLSRYLDLQPRFRHASGAPPKYVDVRYSSGVAVAWPQVNMAQTTAEESVANAEQAAANSKGVADTGFTGAVLSGMGSTGQAAGSH